MPHAPPPTRLPGIRRRRPSTVPREKTSLSIRADVLEAAREVVQAGEAENLSALVEAALEEKLRRTRRAALYGAYEAAAQDAEFMSDMRSVSEQFEPSASDGL
jgi:hypothetical protein